MKKEESDFYGEDEDGNCNKYLGHILDESCWCDPEVIDGIIVHRRTDN